MSNPITTAVRHALARLGAAQALAGVKVWEGVAPENATYPMVLVQVYGDAQDVSGTAGFRAATKVTLLVRAVTRGGDLAAAETLDNAIDGALHRSGPTVYQSGRVDGCVRTAQHQMTDVAGGKTYRYLGGYYDAIVS